MKEKHEKKDAMTLVVMQRFILRKHKTHCIPGQGLCTEKYPSLADNEARDGY